MVYKGVEEIDIYNKKCYSKSNQKTLKMKKILMCIAITAMFVSCKKETCKNSEAARLEIRMKSINLPAGCTSTAGYSALTGQPCNGAVQSNIQVSPTVATYNVPILSFSMKAVGGVIDIRSIMLPYDGQAYLERVISHAQLYINNTLAGDMDLHSGLITFHGLSIHLEENMTQECTVIADILPSVNYQNGTSLKFYLGSNFIDATSEYGGEVFIDITDTPERSALYLYARGVIVTGQSYPTITITSNGSKRFEFKFKVVSYGTDAFLMPTMSYGTTIPSSVGFSWVLENATGQIVSQSVTASASVTTTANFIGTTCILSDSHSEYFTVDIDVSGVPSPGSYKCKLLQLQTRISQVQSSSVTIQDLLPIEYFTTGLIFFN